MKIRNFSIVAHIDHGKTTLSDRILEDTGTVAKRKMTAQLLDGMELEKERGITIKAKAVRIKYKDYELNLIDTPGHVDFSYEVARSLRACEGVLLLVDASQGVEAQTVAHAHLAQSLGLKVIPVMNKVDLSQSDADLSEEQLWEILREPILAERVSAKTGMGVDHLLERIVTDIPEPKGNPNGKPRALIFDSFYDPFRGVIIYVRMFDGSLKQGQTLRLMGGGLTSKIEEIGYMTPQLVKCGGLNMGEVGYIVAGIKDIHSVKVGDTVTLADNTADEPLPGYEETKPVVFASIFPIDSPDYPLLRTALEKLNLSDSSFSYQSEVSKALGFGFRLGFMGLLHIEIVKERLEREFNLSLIATSPNVVYHVKFTSKKSHPQELSALRDAGDGYKVIDNPAYFPPYGDIIDIKEPTITITIVTPVEFMDGVMTLLKEKRGTYLEMEHISNMRVIIKYIMPMAEMVIDFYNKLKSVSKGYASFDYELDEYRSSDVVLMEILIHGEPVDALSVVTHKDKAQTQGRALCEKLKELIGRQMFEIAVQARVNGKIVARETIPAMRKDVIAKCYGGDITRKRKLLEKQKEGKKRMKSIGSVDIPQEAFVAMLKIDQ
ncbi:GTP-binding protein LepA [Elusimicrobium minutum Pei191]|uniref:Elongation factor 4 n=1 Tax=Elusimicrobium minutum (strain Pei191) TaxID=445932 RepID=B2KB02_ELUMP|nr:translation elongation factor 4 [Elusimicrobium minutum]ACC97698.1 GTP-binding protein LepA [Elusimicrobium minutum Pei191]